LNIQHVTSAYSTIRVVIEAVPGANKADTLIVHTARFLLFQLRLKQLTLHPIL